MAYMCGGPVRLGGRVVRIFWSRIMAMVLGRNLWSDFPAGNYGPDFGQKLMARFSGRKSVPVFLAGRPALTVA